MEERYAAQYGLEEIGPAGQEKLKNARILVAGAGGLASTALFCFAGAGVGNITVVDCDRVSLSNLNRQFLHTVANIGEYKTASAYKSLKAFNPQINIKVINEKISYENAGLLVAGHDVIVSAVDNMPTRLALNKAAISSAVPLVNGGVSKMTGSVQCVVPGVSACLACLYGNRGDDGGEENISFAPVVSVVSSLMAQCVLDYLLSGEMPFADGILYYDGRKIKLEKIGLKRSALCPVCGTKDR